MVYKNCLVSECKNTTISSPAKTFIKLPCEGKKRKMWLKSAGRGPNDVSAKSSNLFFCEDHFDLENDMENYMEWKMMGVQKRMKKDVIPHIFNSQNNPKRVLEKPVRNIALKCTKVLILKEAPDKQYIPTVFFGPGDKPGTILNEELPCLSSSGGSISDTDDFLSTYSPEEDSDIEILFSKQQQQDIVQHIYNKIQNNPRIYLGLSNDTLFTIRLIEQFTELDCLSIYLTLQKIRLDRSFTELADDYCMSKSAASKTFRQSVGPISLVLKDLITWVSPLTVKKLMSIPFRTQFSKVYSILDFLEIEIQKSKDPVKNALTWSENLKCNTIKYLVSATPDGFINFVSKGFGGKTSDLIIVEKSGFLNKLQPNLHIMTDRGNPRMSQMLAERQCFLVKPSISCKISTNPEVSQTKKESSIQNQTELLIRRLREFKMLQNHACVHLNLIPYLDSVVTIACALVNVQGSL